MNLMREPHGDRPERDTERRVAGQVLLQAIRDYHCAKHFIQKSRLAKKYAATNSVYFLTRDQTEVLFNGKEAWEWLTKAPLPGPERGWTFDRCCETLDMNPVEVRINAMKPAAARALKNANHGAYAQLGRKGDKRGRLANQG